MFGLGIRSLIGGNYMKIINMTEKELENAGYELEVELETPAHARAVEESYHGRIGICCGRKMYSRGNLFCLRAPAKEELKIMSENIEDIIGALELAE